MSITGKIKAMIKDFGIEYFQRYYSFYHAKVIDVSDPQKLNRIKLSCAELQIESTNWCYPMGLNSFTKDGNNLGSVSVPEKGASVFVMFKYGKVRQPYYINLYHFQDRLPDIFKENYPNRLGEMYGNELFFMVDRSISMIQLSATSENRITINRDGVFVGVDKKINSVSKYNELNQTLTQIISELNAINSAMSSFMSTQAAVSASGPTAVLLPAYTATATVLTASTTRITNITSTLTAIKSEKLFIDK